MSQPVVPVTLPPRDYQLAGAGSEFLSQLQTQFAQSPLLHVFDAAAVDILADFLQVYRLSTGQVLLREGECSTFAILLLSGSVQVEKSHADGSRHTIASVGPGTLIGEMSLIDGEPRFASCIAHDEVLLAVLTKQSLLGLLEQHPKLGALLLMRLVALVSHRLRQTSAKLVALMALQPPP